MISALYNAQAIFPPDTDLKWFAAPSPQPQVKASSMSGNVLSSPTPQPQPHLEIQKRWNHLRTMGCS